MGLLDGDLQRVFGNAFGPRLLAATLHKVTRADDGEGGYTDTVQDYAVKAMVDSYTKRAKDYSPTNEVKIIVLQYQVPVVPVENIDRISIASKTYRITRVDQDPASAAWTLYGVIDG